MGIFLLLGIVGAIVDGGGETTPKLKATLQQDANGERMTFAFNDRFIYVMNSDGSNPTKLTEGGTPAWSPDGNRIAYTENLKEPNPAASSAPESVDAAPYT